MVVVGEGGENKRSLGSNTGAALPTPVIPAEVKYPAANWGSKQLLIGQRSGIEGGEQILIYFSFV